MFIHLYSAAVSGLKGAALEVECLVSGGLPYFAIVGVSSSQAVGIRERVRGALKSIGESLPASRITVNVRAHENNLQLENASFSYLDLPIALAVLACMGKLPARALEHRVFAGELSLNGDLKPLYGALTMAREISRNLELWMPAGGFFLPADNAAEAAFAQELPIYGIHSLGEMKDILTRRADAKRTWADWGDDGEETEFGAGGEEGASADSNASEFLFDSIYGQEVAKRVAVIACAGMHNLMLVGPPGCGKTMLAQSMPALLPPMTREEKLEVTEIYSNSRLLKYGQSLVTERPFRSPHHTIPTTTLIGGGQVPRPGEITLAHKGVLFLDEMPEFSRASIESLREPLESHEITINRLSGSFRYPADTLLISAMNPCPCSYYPSEKCHCTSLQITHYYDKVKGPLLDRMDLVYAMPKVPVDKMQDRSGITAAHAREVIFRAHAVQRERFGTAFYNSRMSTAQIEEFCQMTEEAERLTKRAAGVYQLTMRGYHKLLRVARTLADMDGQDVIGTSHVEEALQYRTLPELNA